MAVATASRVRQTREHRQRASEGPVRGASHRPCRKRTRRCANQVQVSGGVMIGVVRAVQVETRFGTWIGASVVACAVTKRGILQVLSRASVRAGGHAPRLARRPVILLSPQESAVLLRAARYTAAPSAVRAMCRWYPLGGSDDDRDIEISVGTWSAFMFGCSSAGAARGVWQRPLRAQTPSQRDLRPRAYPSPAAAARSSTRSRAAIPILGIDGAGRRGSCTPALTGALAAVRRQDTAHLERRPVPSAAPRASGACALPAACACAAAQLQPSVH